MKIITNNKAYVQLNDISYLLRSTDLIPASIFEKCFSDIFICTDQNRYEFMEFDTKEEIDFFKNLDYSIDYLALKDLTEKEIIQYGISLSEKRNEIAKKYNAMSDRDKEKNLDMVTQCELLDFKILSVRDILWFKQGHLQMYLPDGIEYPEDTQPQKEKKSGRLSRFLSKFCRNKK